MDEKINNLQLCIEEIHSSVVILQRAIQYENGSISLSDIDNYLEIILERIDKILNELNEIAQKQLN